MTDPARPILLLDDDDAIRDAIAECLAGEGYSVEPFAGGPEALEWLRAGGRPSLVLLDFVMPVMDGAEFIRELRRDPGLAGVPAVVMTAAHPSGARVDGADAVLSKPFELDELLDTVARHAARAA